MVPGVLQHNVLKSSDTVCLVSHNAFTYHSTGVGTHSDGNQYLWNQGRAPIHVIAKKKGAKTVTYLDHEISNHVAIVF